MSTFHLVCLLGKPTHLTYLPQLYVLNLVCLLGKPKHLTYLPQLYVLKT